ncbi:MAG: putative DNA modification/repair radical SAM protein [Hyphomonadaceae bacterium]
MEQMQLRDKLRILADAAKYDASCASSGGKRRDSLATRGIGSNEGAGICHSYTPDGRCVSLLKILLTNHCLYDCAYCINRRSSNVPRARFSVQEVVQLTLDFYRRNYIEGLFLSSGIVKSHDDTMIEMIRVARSLRDDHAFAGYIHLKLIAGASPELLADAGAIADRVSVNVELPREDTLAALAPEKRVDTIRRSMAHVRGGIEAGGEKGAPAFAPAGQSTQMIVGADGASDRDILSASRQLYSSYALKRVYYSAFSPIPDSSARLPLQAAPLMREHRLYQADWMMRFYRFSADEIVTSADGLLDLAIDPKLAWALAHRESFPVDVNRADRDLLLRVPGLGVKSVDKLILARRQRALGLEDVARLTKSISKCRPFIVARDWRPVHLADAELSPARRAEQLDLFA